MKDDAPAPKHPPTKRRHLERAPDLWLAVWATDEELPEAERRRAQEQREARKKANPDCVVGVLVDQEDATPAQLALLKEQLFKAHPTEIHHPWTTRRVAGAIRTVKVPTTTHKNMREVVLAADKIIAIPRAPEHKKHWTPAWDAVRYSKHRKLPITVVLPDGTVA